MAINNQDESAKTIGDRSIDTYLSNTIYGILKMLKDHVHSATKVYPTLANSITLTGGAGAWQEGAFVEVVPASTITDYFDIHWVTLTNPSATDEYEVSLYSGALASEVEIARIRTSREAIQASTPPIGTMTPFIAPNERISAKVASKVGGADTIDIAISYHEY